jgi:hypothetical protein
MEASTSAFLNTRSLIRSGTSKSSADCPSQPLNAIHVSAAHYEFCLHLVFQPHLVLPSEPLHEFFDERYVYDMRPMDAYKVRRVELSFQLGERQVDNMFRICRVEKCILVLCLKKNNFVQVDENNLLARLDLQPLEWR